MARAEKISLGGASGFNRKPRKLAKEGKECLNIDREFIVMFLV